MKREDFFEMFPVDTNKTPVKTCNHIGLLVIKTNYKFQTDAKPTEMNVSSGSWNVRSIHNHTTNTLNCITAFTQSTYRKTLKNISKNG